MTKLFSSECLDIYSFVCDAEKLERDYFFDCCVNERLNYLLEQNSNQLDLELNQLEGYIENIITDKPQYERCSNYKIRNKNLTKYNIRFVNRIIKKYYKLCISSSKLLLSLKGYDSNEKNRNNSITGM